jgi:peptide/nickel transport system substrate-binding protein
MDSFSVRHIPAEGEASSGFYANTERWNTDTAVAYSEIVAQMGNLPPTSPELVDLYVQAMNLWYQEMPALPIVQSAKLTPFDTTNWTNWPTSDNPYAAPATWWPSTLILLTQIDHAGQ